MQEYGNPKPTHSDMAVIPAQGRDPAAVDRDVANAPPSSARANGAKQRPGMGLRR